MPKFPFTNYHELNLDWILKKVTALFDASEENARTIRTYETRLTAAEQTATSAETAATAAQELADAAAANADSALSVAGTADAKADSALTAATTAAGSVAGALTAAQEAQQTAADAVATANDAAATASSLESLANTANQNATAALETAQTADQKAVAAQTAAQTADQKAVAAQSAATTNAGNISTLQTNVTNLNSTSSQLTEDVDNINDLFTYEIGKNLLDESTSVSGYLNSNGTIHANGSGMTWLTTDFIDVEGADYITASADNPDGTSRVSMGTYFWLNYDSNKQIVGSQIVNNTTPYAIPTGVKYIRFSYSNPRQNNPMVEKGNVRTPYEPFVVYTLFKTTDYAKKSEALPNKLNKLKWCVMGDSLTEKNTKANMQYYDYIAQDLNLNIYNLGVSGSGYARSSNAFPTVMNNIEALKTDFVTIFGSFNDADSGLEIGTINDTGNSTICGCINTTLDIFYNKLPFKVIGLITPCPWITIPPDNEWGNRYANAIIEIGKKRGVPVLDLFHCSGIRPWAGAAYLAEYYTENGSTDEGVHPNSKGHKMFLYPQIKQFVLSLIQGLPTD